MAHQAVDIPGPDGVIDAHFYTPDGPGSWPGVIMFTDIFGTSAHFESMAQRLASQGFAVLLPNIYYRMGPGPVSKPAAAPGTPEFMEFIGKMRATVPPEVVRDDQAVLLSWLGANPQVSAARIGMVGYCLSGSFVLRGAADFPDRVGAVASFHGGGLATEAANSPHLRAPEISAAVMLGHATNDNSMPQDAIERLDAALTAANVEFESLVYPGAHGFAVTGSRAYDEASSEAHWTALIRFFKHWLAA